MKALRLAAHILLALLFAEGRLSIPLAFNGSPFPPEVRLSHAKTPAKA